ncbi:hypothetical protein F5I97DRAFT_1831563 [Phlebopus sp. FC_14]|nr:hypothetical protein F5I97DRAFT_1831563 [Phlebopus sp. FC_14]
MSRVMAMGVTWHGCNQNERVFYINEWFGGGSQIDMRNVGGWLLNLVMLPIACSAASISFLSPTGALRYAPRSRLVCFRCTAPAANLDLATLPPPQSILLIIINTSWIVTVTRPEHTHVGSGK